MDEDDAAPLHAGQVSSVGAKASPVSRGPAHRLQKNLGMLEGGGGPDFTGVSIPIYYANADLGKAAVPLSSAIRVAHARQSILRILLALVALELGVLQQFLLLFQLLGDALVEPLHDRFEPGKAFI